MSTFGIENYDKSFTEHSLTTNQTQIGLAQNSNLYSVCFCHHNICHHYRSSTTMIKKAKESILGPHILLDEVEVKAHVGIHSEWARKSAKLSKRRDSNNFVHAIRLRHHNLGESWSGKFLFWAIYENGIFFRCKYVWVFHVQRECNNLVVCSKVMFPPSLQYSLLKDLISCHCIMYEPEVALL